jgi:hypothetical protein
MIDTPPKPKRRRWRWLVALAFLMAVWVLVFRSELLPDPLENLLPWPNSTGH